MVVSSAKVPFGWLTQRYGPDLYVFVITSTASSRTFGMLNQDPFAAPARCAPTLAMTFARSETIEPSLLALSFISLWKAGRCVRVTKSSYRVYMFLIGRPVNLPR